MGRIIFAGLAGGVVYFLFTFLSWMVLGLHEQSVRPLPDDVPITSLLKLRKLETGVYIVPGAPELSEDASAQEIQEACDTLARRHNEGPVYSVFYTAGGGPLMGPATLVLGLLFNVFCATLAAFICSLAATAGYGYLGRVGIVALLGLFAAVTTHLAYWNWMWFAPGHTAAMTADVVIGWLLAALAIAAIVGPRKIAAVPKAPPPRIAP